MVTLVLHAHMPHVLGTPYEYWLHEAVLHCYLPLADMFLQNSKASAALHVSPALVNQLAEADYPERFAAFCRQRAECAKKAKASFEEERALAAEGRGGQPLGLWAQAQENGVLEIWGGTAAHPFLPLLPEADRLRQIEAGLAMGRRFFGKQGGFWTPECALDSPLAKFLADCGIARTCADPGCLDGGPASLARCGGLTLLIRDVGRSNLIWDAEMGYPGKAAYRDFHADYALENPEAGVNLGRSGFSLRAVGDRSNPSKPFYKPEEGLKQAHSDAEAFLGALPRGGELSVLAFDAELFGHWWHEGPLFLRHLFTLAEEGLFVLPSSLGGGEERRILPSTWGTGGDASSWVNPKTESLLSTVLSYAPRGIAEERALVLAQASDWPFLISHGVFAEAAQARVQDLLAHPPRTRDLLWQILKERG